MGRKATGYVDELKTLCNLGLTLQQAKVYLALARIGQASVKDVSAAANIDRGECYRVVCQLIEKRLISKVLTSPIKYDAISFDAGINDLLVKKKQEVSLLEKDMQKLLEKVKANDKPVITEDTENSIRFVPMSPAVVGQINRFSTIGVKKSIDAVMDIPWFESTYVFYKGDMRALHRGVKYRMLISDPKDTCGTKKFRKYTKETGCSLRITTETIAAPICIADKKTAWIFISEDNQVLKSLPLVTNNESLVKIVQCYFDNLWERSKKVEWKEEQNQENH